MSFSDDVYEIKLTLYPNIVVDRLENIGTDETCNKCKFHHLTLADTDFICTRCRVMKIKEPSRFGKLKQSYGDFGELRQQKKEPKLEVYYLPVKAVNEKELRAGKTEVLRSVNNCPSEVINSWIAKVGQNLEAGNLKREYAETILDFCYGELNKRLNP